MHLPSYKYKLTFLNINFIHQNFLKILDKTIAKYVNMKSYHLKLFLFKFF